MAERKWDRCGSVIEPAGGVRWGQSRLSHAHRPHIRWVTTFPLTISLLGNTLKSDLCTPQKTRKRKTDINTVHHAYFFSEHAQIRTKHTIYFYKFGYCEIQPQKAQRLQTVNGCQMYSSACKNIFPLPPVWPLCYSFIHLSEVIRLFVPFSSASDKTDHSFLIGFFQVK